MDAPDPDPRDPLAQPTAARLFALLSSARRRFTTAIAARGGDLIEIEAAGERIGAESAPVAGSGDATALLEEALSAMGFQPRSERDGGRTTFTLTNCPYRDVATINPGVVCTLHRGIARPGLAIRVQTEHLQMRASARALRSGGASVESLHELGELLERHVRFEERELFPLIEGALDEEALGALGADLARAERSD